MVFNSLSLSDQLHQCPCLQTSGGKSQLAIAMESLYKQVWFQQQSGGYRKEKEWGNKAPHPLKHPQDGIAPHPVAHPQDGIAPHPVAHPQLKRLQLTRPQPRHLHRSRMPQWKPTRSVVGQKGRYTLQS